MNLITTTAIGFLPLTIIKNEPFVKRHKTWYSVVKRGDLNQIQWRYIWITRIIYFLASKS